MNQCREATAGQSRFIVEAFPNPVEDVLILRLTGVPGNSATIAVTDASGKRLLQTRMSTILLSIPLNGLTPGLYLLNYTDGIHFQTIKITKP